MRVLPAAALAVFALAASARADQSPGLGPTVDASMFGATPKDGGAASTLRKLVMAGCPTIEAFGGVADGTTDNSAAYLRALSPAEGRLATGAADHGACVSFSAGRYFFGSSPAFSYPATRDYAVVLRGTGSAATNLVFGSANGLQFTLRNPRQTVHLSGLSLQATTQGGGAGLTVTQTSCLGAFGSSTFDDLTFEGADPAVPALQRWDSGALVVGLSGTSWRGVTFHGDDTWSRGSGLTIQGNISACGTDHGYGIYHNIEHAAFNQLGIGLHLGDYTQGVTVNQSNFQNGRIGIFQPAGMAGANVQLNVTNSQFQVGVADVQINTGYALAMFANNLFLMGPNPAVVGIDATGTNLLTAVGNVFNTVSPSGPGGIGIRTNATAGAFHGNAFSGLATGIDLQAGSSNTTIGSNTFNVVSTPYRNSGTRNTLPLVQSGQTANVTSCAPTTYAVPHQLPGTPRPDKVQVSVARPPRSALSIVNPTAWVTGADATTVQVTFACGFFGTAGAVLLNIAASLSN